MVGGCGCGVDAVPDRSAPHVKTTGVWSLYWRDRNLGFHVYGMVAPTASIKELLAEPGSRSHSHLLGLSSVRAAYAVLDGSVGD